MPLFDVRTVLALTALNLFVMALALSLVMGRHLSPAIRYARASLVAQAMGWAAIVAAESVWDLPLSVLAIGCGGLSNWLMLQALSRWLGPRPFGRVMLALSLVLPLVYGLSFESYPVRVAWANLVLATQFALVAIAAGDAPGAPPSSRGWRSLLVLCYGAMAVMTAARGILGGWFTELYPSFTTPHPLNLAAQVAAHVSLVLTMLALLVAWRREVERQLEEQAHTDPLTGLLNRRGWMRQIETALAQAQRQGWQAAVLMLDLDHFKHINDVYGHEAGDRVLRTLARALGQCLRQSDCCGRIGGEEFVLLMLNISAEDAQRLDARLRETFRRMAAERLRLDLNFSSGLALFDPRQRDGLRKALIRADGAMYQAKASGRGRLCTDEAVRITTPDAVVQ